MSQQSADITLAVVVSKLDDIREDILDLKRHAITRAEYDERNRYIDARLTHKQNDINRLAKRVFDELARIDSEARSRTAPWWSVAALFVSAGALLWVIIGPAVTGVQ